MGLCATAVHHKTERLQVNWNSLTDDADRYGKTQMPHTLKTEPRIGQSRQKIEIGYTNNWHLSAPTILFHNRQWI
jgi:hypothetical protein